MASHFLRKCNVESLIFLTNNLVTKVRSISTYQSDLRVVASNDGQTVVCWHPEEEFPYEYSLPIKREAIHDSSVLKMKDLSAFYGQKKEFEREALMRLTFTTKHRWFPEGKNERRKRRKVEECRPYL